MQQNLFREISIKKTQLVLDRVLPRVNILLFPYSKNLTLTSGEPPTRALFGHTWARVHHHPGQYCRGRYGNKYLKHLQSWRHIDRCKNTAMCKYGDHVAWAHCKDSSHHACLELYPSDGNIEFLPHRYP